MSVISTFTIGFTQTTAENFFNRLIETGVRKIIDVRLNNTSQLSGFAKVDDLAYFLKKIGEIQYTHQPMLAPTDLMLKEYKKNKGDWRIYETQFLTLMAERQIEKRLRPEMLSGACLLCSESTAHHCHRRLVCEYLNQRWDDALVVRHL